MMRSVRWMVMFGFLAPLLTPIARAQTYVAADLDPVGMLATTYVSGIRAGGAAVGFGTFGPFGPARPAVFTSAGAKILPLMPTDLNATAAAIDAAGTIVGTCLTTGPTGGLKNSARIWINGQASDLSSLVTTPTNLDLRLADAIEGGVIVGAAYLPPAQDYRAFAMSNGTVTDLHLLVPAGALASAASRVGPNGEIVGWYQLAGYNTHACSWIGGVFTDLNDPAQGSKGSSDASDVDRFGRICGTEKVDGVTSRAVLFDHGTRLDLGSLGTAGKWSWGRGMNDLGVVVGQSELGSGFVAFRWQNGVMVDLNTLIPPGSGWSLEDAIDVDNDGRIVGDGTFGGASRAFRLTPNCAGGYTVTGVGCPGITGVAPTLGGVACPTAGATFGLAHQHTLPGTPGVLLLGTGSGTIPVTLGCALHIAPLFPTVLPFQLDAKGSALLPLPIPQGVTGVTVSFQSLLADPGGIGGIVATNPLQVNIQ